MEFRNQNLRAWCAHCYWIVTAPRHSQQTELENIHIFYLSVYLSTYLPTYLENRELTLIPLILI